MAITAEGTEDDCSFTGKDSVKYRGYMREDCMAFGGFISVIVPVYNVRQYLHQCLDSLKRQEYPSFEVVLVDDGSTDGSGSICDEYAASDERFMVVHQSNRGLSAARNAGLAHSSGEYISFMDSDDWVSPHYLPMLMSAIERSGMPCASLAHLETFRDGHDCGLYDGHDAAYAKTTTGIVEIKDETSMQKALLRQRVNCGAQARLCRRDALLAIADDGRVFPEGLLYEDLATGYRIIHKTQGSALVYGNLYAYRRRHTSIMGNRDALHDEKVESAIHVAHELYRDMARWYPELSRGAASRCLALLCTVYSSLDMQERGNEEAVWREIRRYADLARGDAGARLKDRLAVYCSGAGRRMFSTFCRLYRACGFWDA